MRQMFFLRAMFLATLFAPTLASAQKLSPGGEVRRWVAPGSKWVVYLNRLTSRGGRLGCLLITGFETAGRPDRHTWGFRSSGGELLLLINSFRPEDVEGNSISFAVDGSEVAKFAIGDRPGPARDYNSVFADVPAAQQQRILSLLQGGRRINLNNGGKSFEALLDEGSAAAFKACRQEAELVG